MRINMLYNVPVDVSEKSAFDNADFDHFHSDFKVVDENGSYLLEDLAWKLNLEMRHAVLPVTIFVGVEAIVGFVGNFLVLYVFIFRYPVSNFRYFVLSLAFVDFLSTLTTLPGEIVTQLYWYVYPLPYVCKIKSFFNVFTVSAEALFLFTIAVDRYRKVCTPFGKQIKPEIAKIICILIYIIAFILALPVAFLWGTNSHKKMYKDHIITVTVCEKDQYFVNTVYPQTYVIIIQTVLVICLVSMLILYILVAKKLILCRTRAWQNSGSTVVYSQTNGNLASLNCDQSENADQELPSVHEMPESSEFSAQNQVTLQNKAVQTCENLSQLDISRQTEATSVVSNEQLTPNTVPRRLCQNFVTTTARQRITDAARVRRKTLIMFILTVVFIVTTILYLTLLSMIASSEDILQDMSDTAKVAYFFFFRLVFINHVINPFIYGFLDPQFNSGLANLKRSLLGFYRVRVRPN